MKRGKTSVARWVSVGVMISTLAQAQQRDPPAAEALFLRGRAALEAGRLEEACASFAESYRLDATVGTLLNQARCEELRGLLADAWEHYQAAIEQLPPEDERRTAARTQSDALSARIPRLTLRLAPGFPPGSRVFRDKIELQGASLGTALPLNPGAHEIEWQSPGRKPRSMSFEIKEGERLEKILEPGPLLAPPPASSSPPASPPPPSPAAPSTAKTAGWVLGGIGATALLASMGLGLWALDRRKAVREHCPGNQCNAEGLQAGGELRVLTRASTGSAILGAIGLGTGAYVLISGRF